MPGIGAAAMLGIELQKGRAVRGRHGGVRFDLAEQPPEGLVRCIRQMVLAPEEQRSEEHTSELQSPCNLVCRLLLEKKKQTSRYRSPSSARRRRQVILTREHDHHRHLY